MTPDVTKHVGIFVDADFAAGNTGYIVVEVCFIQPDVAVEYSDIEQYLPYKTEGLKPGQYGN